MPTEVQIAVHVYERYIERFNPNLAGITNKIKRYRAADAALRAIINDGKYVSDSKRGILFESKIYNAKFIVRKNIVRTIWQDSDKIKVREQKPREPRG
jgi:hypothetical protein